MATSEDEQRSSCFVMGWGGDESQEVDIVSCDDQNTEAEQSQPSETAVTGASSSENQGRNGRKAVMAGLGSDSKRLDARGYRKALTHNASRKCTKKGKEPATEFGAYESDQKRRKLSGGLSFAEATDSWKNTQWVACSLCKKWRRIPFQVDLDRSTFKCQDNEWSSVHKDCDCPQEEAATVIPATFDSPCSVGVFFPKTSFGSKTPAGEDADSVPPPGETQNSVSGLQVQDTRVANEPSGVSGAPSNSPATLASESPTMSCTGPRSKNSSPSAVTAIGDPDATVDSIWNSIGDQAGEEKLYKVKWKGRSHVHNSLLNEAELMKLAPKMMSKFKEEVAQGKALKWDPAWTEPERIIGKRISGQTEWLVKWKSLGYEQSTWEPANIGPLATHKVQRLLDLYERWSGTTACTTSLVQNQQDSGKSLEQEHLSQCQLEILKNLRDCWRNQNEGIVLTETDQKQFIPVVAFVISLFRDSRMQQPVLVLTSTDMMDFWDMKLAEWASDLNTIKYHGSPEARHVIQEYEFELVEEHLKIQIAISTFDVVNSDVEFLKKFTWGAILVDEGHRVKAEKCHFPSIQQLPTGFRLIFCANPWKIDVEEQQQMVSFFSREDENGAAGADVKEKLSDLIIWSEPSKLSEYWVPVQMSPLQIHQYCQTLTEHYELLCSGNICHFDILARNLIQMLQACCCHPYLVADTLRESVESAVPPAELLAAGIRASGKLDLMHKMLLEFYLKKDAVLILIQSARRTTVMDILADYLSQQFGKDSYERIEQEMDSQRRQESLRRFNARDSGCFALLVDQGADLSHKINGRTIDAVLIYESDFNPWNDTAFLQKLGVGTRQAKVYRLYSCFSVEERILEDARRGVVYERNMENINAKMFQEILRWGAKMLVQLDDRVLEHDEACSDPRIGWERLTEKDLLDKDGLKILTPDEVKLLVGVESSALLSDKIKAILLPRKASATGPPLCEDYEDGTSSAETFWSPLLHAKYAERQEQTRKRAAHREGSNNDDERESKRRKAAAPDGEGPLEPSPQTGDLNMQDRAASSCSAEVGTAPSCSQTTRSQRDEQRNLFVNVQPELKLLCETLKLPVNVLERAEELLAFVMNHLRMAPNFIHEVELSLCWIAAEEMGVHFNSLEAASLASSKLGFEIDDESLETVFGRLKRRCSVVPSKRHTQISAQTTEVAAADKDKQAHPGGSEKDGPAILDNRKAELIKERSGRSQKILNRQKQEWCDFLKKERQESESLQRLQAARYKEEEASQGSDVQRRQRLLDLKRTHEAELRKLNEKHKKERAELARKQLVSRNSESQLINSQLDQLQAGLVPDPLPELEMEQSGQTCLEDAEATVDVEQTPAEFDVQSHIERPGLVDDDQQVVTYQDQQNILEVQQRPTCVQEEQVSRQLCQVQERPLPSEDPNYRGDFAGPQSQVTINLPVYEQPRQQLPQECAFISGIRPHSHWRIVAPEQDPLRNEETKLEKELEKMERDHREEVSKLNKEIEFWKKKLEDAEKSFEQKREAVRQRHYNVYEQRCIAKVLRNMESATRRAQAPVSAIPFASASTSFSSSPNVWRSTTTRELPSSERPSLHQYIHEPMVMLPQVRAADQHQEHPSNAQSSESELLQTATTSGTGMLSDVVDNPIPRALQQLQQQFISVSQHPLDNRASLSQRDYICLSDDD